MASGLAARFTTYRQKQQQTITPKRKNKIGLNHASACPPPLFRTAGRRVEQANIEFRHVCAVKRPVRNDAGVILGIWTSSCVFERTFGFCGFFFFFLWCAVFFLSITYYLRGGSPWTTHPDQAMTGAPLGSTGITSRRVGQSFLVDRMCVYCFFFPLLFLDVYPVWWVVPRCEP